MTFARGRETREIGRAEMLDRGRACARRLRSLGVRPGDRVLAMVPTSPEFLTLLAGTWMASASIVVVPGPVARAGRAAWRARLAAMIATARPRVIAGTDDALAEVRDLPGADGESGARSALIPTDGLEMRNGSSVGDASRPAADDVAVLQFTSGSTGGVAAAVIRHGQIVENLRAMAARVGRREEDRFVSWLPLYHDMGLVLGLLYPLRWGLPAYLMSPDAFVRTPGAWLRAMSSFRATLCAAPPVACDLVTRHVPDRRLEGVDLSAWRYAWIGSEQVFLPTLERFRDRLAPYGLRDECLHPGYGLAEATLAVSHAAPEQRFRAEWIDRDRLRAAGVAEPVPRDAPGSVPVTSNGPPLDGVEVRALGPAGRTLPERHEGLICVRGPSVTSGYFRSRKSPVRNGWLDTGDLGFVAGGEVFITGRKKDLLIRGGVKYRPAEIESAVSGVDGLRPGRVAAVPLVRHDAGREEIVVVAETRSAAAAGPGDAAERERLASAIRKVVADEAALQVDRVVLVPPNGIPRTSSGKIQRSTCARRLTEGEGR